MKQQFQPRIHVEFSDATHHQLKCYALAATAAGVGALALAQPAEAKIVFSYPPCPGCGYIAALTVADFNQDGITDIAVTGSLRNSLFYGKGKGQFKTPMMLPKLLGGGGLSLASGDFDHDGAPDLAISIGGKIAVLLNRR